MYNFTHAEWQEKAGNQIFRNQCFIDGKFIHASDDQKFESINGQVIMEVARGTKSDIDKALSAAPKAFNDKRWCALTPEDRKEALLNLASQIRGNNPELALMDTLDMAAWKLATALATGSSAVLQPAEQSPLPALRLTELASEAGYLMEC